MGEVEEKDVEEVEEVEEVPEEDKDDEEETVARKVAAGRLIWMGQQGDTPRY